MTPPSSEIQASDSAAARILLEDGHATAATAAASTPTPPHAPLALSRSPSALTPPASSPPVHSVSWAPAEASDSKKPLNWSAVASFLDGASVFAVSRSAIRAFNPDLPWLSSHPSTVGSIYPASDL